MRRYISVKWLEDNAKEYSLGYYEEDEWATPLSALDDAPSIEIIRCRECKSSYTVDFTNTPARVIKRFCRIRRNALTGSFTVQDDDFCSYGCRGSEKPNNSTCSILEIVGKE